MAKLLFGQQIKELKKLEKKVRKKVSDIYNAEHLFTEFEENLHELTGALSSFSARYEYLKREVLKGKK